MVKYFSSSCMGILKWEVFLESHGFSYLEVERSAKTLLYDAFACAFDLRCSFLRLLSKTNHSFACKTNRIVTGGLQSIETITHAWSVSASSQSTLFKSKMVSYHMVVLE